MGESRFFTTDEQHTVDRLCELLIPGDPSAPGAHEAGVAGYIDLVLQYSAPAVREAWRNGIASVERAAGAHDLIVGLRNGYDTMLGGPGLGLSTGQQQRIALARALYGDPFLVVLDEPNANLDAEGEQALTRAIQTLRNAKSIVIVISHRPSALAGVEGTDARRQKELDAAHAALSTAQAVLAEFTS